VLIKNNVQSRLILINSVNRVNLSALPLKKIDNQRFPAAASSITNISLYRNVHVDAYEPDSLHLPPCLGEAKREMCSLHLIDQVFSLLDCHLQVKANDGICFERRIYSRPGNLITELQSYIYTHIYVLDLCWLMCACMCQCWRIFTRAVTKLKAFYPSGSCLGRVHLAR
jgi:hypothetical protein